MQKKESEQNQFWEKNFITYLYEEREKINKSKNIRQESYLA